MGFDPLQAQQLRLDGRARGWLGAAAAAAGLGVAASALLGLREGGREAFFQAWLANLMFFVSLALGALFFVLISHLTRAGWSVALRRIAETFAWTIVPLGLCALVPLFGLHELYHWSHADAVAHDPLLQGKAPWLEPTFFRIRVVLYFAIWGALATFYLRRSVRQDASGDPAITLQLERLAPLATILYAVTVTLASFDLLMSLNPHWYSTIFGVYYFAGAFLGFTALAPLWIALLRRGGALARVVTTEHLHDLGKLMFAFVVFWAYIAFSQYFLIWYGNVPEETVWFQTREARPWSWLSLTLLLGHFVLPFLLLLSRHPKRRGASLVAAAAWLLAMHWIDLYYLVLPGLRQGAPLRAVDLTCFVGLAGVFFAAATWRARRAPLVPLRDPRIAESLGFENA